MYKKIVLVLLFSVVGFINCKAQFNLIQGKIVDTQRHIAIQSASISAIKDKDSTLISYTRSNADGTFKLYIPSNIKYRILYEHPSYASFEDEIDLKNTNINLKDIALTNRTQMLQTIVVRQKGSIKIKGDTTVYMVDSFKVDDNASVEDLLKILPGMQVDKNGNIITQGEQVQKVLVDGDEFFGDDPTVATKNLQAKIVDKIEVFDNKSEQAKFTGFDDGQKEKTINLKMKKDMNKGYFGKAQLASNGDQIWDNSLMLSNFKNKRKFSIYAINSSNGTSGLNWNDRDRFGGSNDVTYVEEGGFYMSSDDGSSYYNGDGLPKANNIGVHYSNKWNENKYALTTNGNLRENFLNNHTTINQTNYLGVGSMGTKSDAYNYSDKKNAKLNTKYEWVIDTTSSIVLFVDGGQTKTYSESLTNTSNIRDTAVVSNSNRNFINNSTNQSLSLDATYKKRFKKIGQTISFNTNWSWKDNEQNGKLIGTNDYISKQENLNQLKIINNKTIVGSLQAIYTQQIYKDKIFGEFTNTVSYSDAQQNKITDVQPFGSNDYTKEIDSLSNKFISKIFSDAISLKLMYKSKKIMFNLGNAIKATNYNQQDLIRNKLYNYNRLNYLPSIFASYKITSQQSIRFNYNGSTTQPTLMQLQNVADNSDPLNITIGNPNLKQSYRQSFSINYWNYQTLNEKSISASTYFGNTYNAITNTQFYEASTGRTINTYTNLNGRFNGNFYSSYHSRIGSSDFSYSVGPNFSYNRSPNIVNNITSVSNNFNPNLSVGLRYMKKKKFEGNIDLEAGENFFSNKILNQKNAYLTFTPRFDGEYYVTKRLILYTDANYIWNQKNTVYAENFSRLIWNSSIGYRFLPHKNLEAKFLVHDILKQNNGYTRTSSGNSLTEKTNNSIRRYALLSLVYNFSIGPINKLPKNDED